MRKCTLGMALIGLFLTGGLVGCGKEEIKFREFPQDVTENKEETVQPEETEGSDLFSQLEIEEDDLSWKETIECADGSVDMKAKITLPDTDRLYTMTASKWYLTGEDKKRILHYFAKPQTIRVDTESIRTKEDIRESMKEMEADLDEFAEDTSYYDYLSMRLESAPSKDSLSPDVGDYSMDCYLGEDENGEIQFRFYCDETRNRSAFSMERTDVTANNSGLTGMGNNECAMSPDEAKEKAVALCSDLGFPNMDAYSICDLERIEWDGETEDDMNKRLDGYCITLVRNIQDTATDGQYYLYSDNPNGTSSAVRMDDLPYSRECIEIMLDDKCIISVKGTGLLTAGKIGEPVRLLSLSKIKDVIRNELSLQEGSGMEYNALKLTYLRVNATDGEDDFCFIPVWKLSPYNWEMYNSMQLMTDSIWINAIDGTRIDLVKSGAVTMYMESQSFGDYE